jgi:hypothetical protein
MLEAKKELQKWFAKVCGCASHGFICPPPAWAGVGEMDIATGVINVMTYFEGYGAVNMLETIHDFGFI